MLRFHVTNDAFDTNRGNVNCRTIDHVVDPPYTTQQLQWKSVLCSAVPEPEKEERCGFRSAQRQHLLPGAQRAPVRESAAVAFSASGGTAAYHGRCGSQSIAKSSVARSGLAGPARAGERADRAVRHTLAVRAEPDAFVTQP